jgi:hypothetical protein
MPQQFFSKPSGFLKTCERFRQIRSRHTDLFPMNLGTFYLPPAAHGKDEFHPAPASRNLSFLNKKTLRKHPFRISMVSL